MSSRGEIGRRENLDHDEGRQAQREDPKHARGLLRVERRERAALEQHLDDRHRHDGERHRGRHGKEHRKFEAAVLAVEHRGVIAGAKLARHVRQKHHADGDADDSERQLIEAVGIIEL